ncbi:Uncharacterized protein QJS10_CPA16g01547 [Acorus calamus]|uniref:O-fucosyltransferase family protein n=1 Tax=Acorus calamus TaxID=4465 RepID=A0AAV9D0B1_ACOCL|nr:Uncharacterized protein QJS10_CPA16g01547 [Acorus calamus]
MIIRSKIKLVALVGAIFSVVSLLVHLLLAQYSSEDWALNTLGSVDDFYRNSGEQVRNRRLWGPVKSLETLQPHASPRNEYPVPKEQNNGYIYAKIYGGFEKIRTSDVHTELIQYWRKQLIKRRLIREPLRVDSLSQKNNGSCPLMPEEVGLLLRAIGHPPNTLIYVAGSEIFGGQRVLIPLRSMYNVMDRTSLCSRKELLDLLGPETALPSDLPNPPPSKTEAQLIEEWKKAGPRPRPLPPPPARPFYRHEKEGWYGWVAETDKEPDASPMDMRNQAHRLLWDALDYIVSVEADAFFPGYNNDGSGWPDFSSLVMGQRMYEMASSVTYRPNRKILAGLLDGIRDNLYHPKRNWTIAVREHLNKTLGFEGLIMQSQASKSLSFLSHPLPECSCRTSQFPNPVKGKYGELLYGGEDKCPDWMPRSNNLKEDTIDEADLPEDDIYPEEQPESVVASEQDDEMDPDD